MTFKNRYGAEENTVTHDDKREMIIQVMTSPYELTFETKQGGGGELKKEKK